MLKVIERYILENKEEWKEVRKGLFTGSRISEIIPGVSREMTETEKEAYKKENPKGRAQNITDPYGIGDGAKTYIKSLIRSMRGAPDKDVQTFAMLRGIETEPFAVQAYCDKYGYDLNSDEVIYTSQGGTVFFVGDDLIGATPDLIILGKKIVQIKCPDSDTHMDYLLEVTAENFKQHLSKYYWQMQTEMMLAQVDEGDFVSYDDRYPIAQDQMFVVTIKANKEDQKFIIDKAKICEAKKKEYLEILNERK